MNWIRKYSKDLFWIIGFPIIGFLCIVLCIVGLLYFNEIYSEYELMNRYSKKDIEKAIQMELPSYWIYHKSRWLSYRGDGNVYINIRFEGENLQQFYHQLKEKSKHPESGWTFNNDKHREFSWNLRPRLPWLSFNSGTFDLTVYNDSTATITYDY